MKTPHLNSGEQVFCRSIQIAYRCSKMRLTSKAFWLPSQSECDKLSNVRNLRKTDSTVDFCLAVLFLTLFGTGFL